MSYDGEWRPPEQPQYPYGPWTPSPYGQLPDGPVPENPPPPLWRRRWFPAVLAVGVVLLIFGVGMINIIRRGPEPRPPAFTFPALPGPSATDPNGGGSGGNGGGNGGGSGGTPVPAVACPVITDADSHLRYRCVDDSLQQGLPDSYLQLRIVVNHEVEPGWVISEGSGKPLSTTAPPTTTIGFGDPAAAPSSSSSPSPSTAPAPTLDQIQTEVATRTALALQRAYGDSPTAKTLSAVERTLSGRTGFVINTEVTINPAYRSAQQLKVKTERLWTVGLPTPAGISIFMLSIPDERSDLWPKADATIATITVI